MVACVAALLFLCAAFFAFYQGVGADARLRVAETRLVQAQTDNTTANNATAAALAKVALAEAATKAVQSKIDEQVAENSRLKGEQNGLTKTYADLKGLCERKAPVVVAAPRTNPSQGHVAAGTPAHEQAGQPSPSVGILLWHPPEATAANPTVCIVSAGKGLGMPPYCNGFTVSPTLSGETKDQWLVRVGGGERPTDTGMYHKAGFVPK
jgi:hypothetical protein